MKTKIPAGLKGKHLFDWLVNNKAKLITEKKSSLKWTEPLTFPVSIITSKVDPIAAKAAGETVEEPVINEDIIHVKVVGNTAWFCDDQMDVLTGNCYDRSIKEKGINIPHIQDHIWKASSHIGDVTAVYTQSIALKELGLDQDGKTIAFVMETDVRKDYDPKIFLLYKNGKIKQHSISIRYISMGLCINDKDYLAENELWNKYYDSVINKDLIDEEGYFWIVTEVVVIENSSVLFGCNELTPTLEITGSKSTEESPEETSKETPDTKPQKSLFSSLVRPSQKDAHMITCPGCKSVFDSSELPESSMGVVDCPMCGQGCSENKESIGLSIFKTITKN